MRDSQLQAQLVCQPAATLTPAPKAAVLALTSVKMAPTNNIYLLLHSCCWCCRSCYNIPLSTKVEMQMNALVEPADVPGKYKECLLDLLYDWPLVCTDALRHSNIITHRIHIVEVPNRKKTLLHPVMVDGVFPRRRRPGMDLPSLTVSFGCAHVQTSATMERSSQSPEC